MRQRIFTLFLCAVVLSACNKPEAKLDADASDRVLQISPEDLLPIQTNALAMGAVITGTV